MKKFLFLFFYIALQISFLAQPTQEWVSRYQSPTGIITIANRLALDKVGNCYMLGEFATSSNNVILVKYNSAGNTVWTRAYQSPVNDFPLGIVVDSIGNSYITFYNGSNFGPYDIITIKYNPQGIQQWLTVYDGGGNDEPSDIVMDKQGDVYVGGLSGNESLIIKYNPINGDTIWTRKYSQAGFRFPSITITTDSRDNVYLGGGKINNSNGTQDYYTIKYDSNGLFKWIKSYSLNGIAVLRKVKVDINLNVFVTGQSINNKLLTIKYDSLGVEQWQRIYDGSGTGTDRPTGMRIDNFNNIIITGVSPGAGSGSDYLTIKYNTVGDSLWVKRYNGPGNGNDESYSLDLDDSNNIYITGRSIGNFSNWDYATIKYNSSGIQQWLVRYPGTPSGGIAYSIALDKFRNVFVTGISDSSSTGGYVTIKYSQPVGIVNISTHTPNQFYLSQNYPNPFNPKTNIEYELPKSVFVKLVVYDVLGREVVTLVNQQQSAGTYRVDFDASAYPSGIYFYTLTVRQAGSTTGEYTKTNKMVLLK